ncbi:MAG: NYN domain-containing protein [Erysipelotrichaceae bacterium]|nr:NYN domain-containing protein [Erysipelotrichaceae bacterium]
MKRPSKQPYSTPIIHDNIRTAILIDGGFYRKRAIRCFGFKTPKERAEELDKYCKRHLSENINGVTHEHNLYRIFYYDCPPSKKAVYNPVTKNNDELSKSELYSWVLDFLEELKNQRKYAVRLGELSEAEMGYYLSPSKTKDILTGKLKPEDIKESDLRLYTTQKGVDMRIGLDISSMAYKKQVDQIVLISGDSDFVPAAKLARREGVDFVLDPLGSPIKANLMEHIDGLRTPDNAFKTKK